MSARPSSQYNNTRAAPGCDDKSDCANVQPDRLCHRDYTLAHHSIATTNCLSRNSISDKCLTYRAVLRSRALRNTPDTTRTCRLASNNAHGFGMLCRKHCRKSTLPPLPLREGRLYNSCLTRQTRLLVKSHHWPDEMYYTDLQNTSNSIRKHQCNIILHAYVLTSSQQHRRGTRLADVRR